MSNNKKASRRKNSSENKTVVLPDLEVTGGDVKGGFLAGSAGIIIQQAAQTPQVNVQDAGIIVHNTWFGG